jgi:hypothetical protein
MRARMSMTEIVQVAGIAGNWFYERGGGWIKGCLRLDGKNNAIKVA